MHCIGCHLFFIVLRSTSYLYNQQSSERMYEVLANSQRKVGSYSSGLTNKHISPSQKEQHDSIVKELLEICSKLVEVQRLKKQLEEGGEQELEDFTSNISNKVLPDRHKTLNWKVSAGCISS